MEKYICVHGHFYQPPRENAWLEVIEYQESAHPFHDWNERINAECYAPNAAARILDSKRMIKDIVNNYGRMSFNMGPTLLSWIEAKDPETYKLILKGDKEGMERFGGHGTAIAQAHSHSIMPLNNARDKETQVIWGIKDFEYRFDRKPEGMWVAESAVDTDTLEVMAKHGIKYTILAPRQAKAIKKLNANEWTQLDHAAVDPRRPYLCNLPSGNSIILFFYDGQVAQDVAFKGLLNSGKSFAARLVNALDHHNDEPQLSHIATDGESYGHHHRYGEMALADAFYTIERENLAKLTNYGQYLELHPPTYEAQIHENSSWSCVHGVERWRSNCGCHTGGLAGWTQTWRKPLRDALDWLRDEVIAIYEDYAPSVLKNPWEARDEYIHVILDRSEEAVKEFFEMQAAHELSRAELVKASRLLEMQRNALYMYTSCGWFFNEISGIETTQILQYACRCIYYARQVANKELEEEFLKRLALAPSNYPEHKDGAHIYKNLVKPAEVGLEKTGIHFAIASIFAERPNKLALFNYEAENQYFNRLQAGRQRLVVGRTYIKSRITQSRKCFNFAVLYLGQQNIIGNVSVSLSEEDFLAMQDEIKIAFDSSKVADVIGVMQQYFGAKKYTIADLFKDEKIAILNSILTENLKSVKVSLTDIYYDNYHLMNTYLQNNLSIRQEYKEIVQYVLNDELHTFLSKDNRPISELKRITSEIKKWSVKITDKQTLELEIANFLYKNLKYLQAVPEDIEFLQYTNKVYSLLQTLKLKPNNWKSQNLYYDMYKKLNISEEQKANTVWQEAFTELGTHLGVKINIEEKLLVV